MLVALRERRLPGRGRARLAGTAVRLRARMNRRAAGARARRHPPRRPLRPRRHGPAHHRARPLAARPGRARAPGVPPAGALPSVRLETRGGRVLEAGTSNALLGRLPGADGVKTGFTARGREVRGGPGRAGRSRGAGRAARGPRPLVDRGGSGGEGLRGGAPAWLSGGGTPPSLLGAVAAAWATSFAGTFQFDDWNVIVDEPRVASPAAWWASMPGIRPLLKLTYAARPRQRARPRRLPRREPRLPRRERALALALLRRRVAVRTGADGAAARAAPLLGALLFALHPVQVESVTYVSGRSSSLAGLLVLASVVAWIAGGRPAGPGSGRGSPRSSSGRRSG